MGGKSQGLGGDPVRGLPSSSTQTHPSALPPSHPTPTLPSSKSSTHERPVHTHTTTPLAPWTIPAANPQRNEGRKDWASSSDVGSTRQDHKSLLLPPCPCGGNTSPPAAQLLTSIICPPAEGPRLSAAEGGTEQSLGLREAAGGARSTLLLRPPRLLHAQKSQKET